MHHILKQNDGFSCFEIFGELIGGNDGRVLDVDEQTYKDLEDGKLMWSNGELVANTNYETYKQEQQLKKLKRDKQKRIAELKDLLAESDYRAIKYAEGEYTESYYQPFKEQRRAWRDEINQLEEELSTLQ